MKGDLEGGDIDAVQIPAISASLGGSRQETVAGFEFREVASHKNALSRCKK